MDEPKYRYYDPYNEVMSYSDGQKLSSFFKKYELLKEYGNKPILMKDARLKDKNGKDIYDGDILKSNNVLYTMTNEAGKAIEIHNEEYNHHYFLFNHILFLEVRGNIYKNPELLQASGNE